MYGGECLYDVSTLQKSRGGKSSPRVGGGPWYYMYVCISIKGVKFDDWGSVKACKLLNFKIMYRGYIQGVGRGPSGGLHSPLDCWKFNTSYMSLPLHFENQFAPLAIFSVCRTDKYIQCHCHIQSMDGPGMSIRPDQSNLLLLRFAGRIQLPNRKIIIQTARSNIDF